LEGDPDIDSIFTVRRREWTSGIFNPGNLSNLTGAFSALRRRNFDAAIDFQGNMRSAVVTFGSGARLRIGFTPGRVKEYCHVCYTRHVFLPGATMHRVQKNLLLLEALGIKPELLPADLKVLPGDGGTVSKFLKEKNLAGRRIVAMHPGVSRFGAFKQWLPERFAEVARRLADMKNCAVVVTWGPGERRLAQDVVRLAGARPVLGPEPHGLRELACLLKESALFIGCDTGPLHIAAAVGTPVVAIFGPKDPRVYGPAGEGHIVVRRELECSPCQLRTCRDPRCMRLITADEVHRACLQILG
jgi:ADP-heptose:LPS heptosyltransferase